MNTGITRFTVIFVLLAQWIAVAVMLRIGPSYGKIFKDFSMQVPWATTAALWLTQGVVLVPIAVVTTAVVVASEFLLKSERFRLLLQVTDFYLWLALACYSLTALMLAMVQLVGRLAR